MWIRGLYNKNNVESKQRFRIDGVFPGNYNEDKRQRREKQMEQKLLFFDIDGTLITEGPGVLPESTRQAICMAKERGHFLFVNTGRTLRSLPKKITELGFSGYVCGCGTHIFLNGEELLCSRLDNSLCRQAAEKIGEYQVPVFYEAVDAIYSDHRMQEHAWVRGIEEALGIHAADIREIFQDETKVYEKLVLILEPTEKNQELKEYLSQYFLCIDRGNNMYEMIQKGYSKATGIRFLCEYLGKSMEDCYVFGDSENDRAMLEAVPNSIAMGNAQESIKSACSYVTADIEEDGIYKAMKHFGLI